MSDEAEQNEDHPQESYLSYIEARAAAGRYQMWARAMTAQALWLVVILAGAAIPLNTAIDGPTWVEPWLGFVVVAAAGIERIFARTSAKASAVDSLRRDLEQRTRRLKAGAIPPYPDATFDAFVEECEKSISAHNQEVIKRNRRLFGG